MSLGSFVEVEVKVIVEVEAGSGDDVSIQCSGGKIYSSSFFVVLYCTLLLYCSTSIVARRDWQAFQKRPGLRDPRQTRYEMDQQR